MESPLAQSCIACFIAIDFTCGDLRRQQHIKCKSHQGGPHGVPPNGGNSTGQTFNGAGTTESKKTQSRVEINRLYNLSRYHSQSNAWSAQAIFAFSAAPHLRDKQAVNAQHILWALVTEGNEQEILKQSLHHQHS